MSERTISEPDETPDTDRVVLALATCPDQASARQIAATLVEERLATCINRLAGVQSTYFWDGHLQDDAEILLIMKTTAGRLSQLTARLKSLHPYELPELIALPVTGGNERYLDWVRAGTRSATPIAANTSGSETK